MADRVEAPQWRTSTRSGGGSCVQVNAQPHEILVRDSKNPDGAVLAFGPGTFRDFIAGVRAGEFDLPN
jgi:hypothetical protein